MKKEKEEKPRMSSISRAALTILAAGFTLISAWNGFTFYRVLFGMSMAILITATFEVARMTCLFGFIRKGKAIGMLSLVTYAAVASVCAFAAINSFCYEVILKEQATRDQYRGQVHKIKQEYTRSVAEKITDVAKEITQIEKVLSSYPSSATWSRRLATAVAKRDRLVVERDQFLKEEPEDPEQWVRKNSALLGMELEAKSRESEEMVSVKKALQELWGLDENTARKIMGIVITATVELCILLLSILTGVADKIVSVANVVAGVANPADVADVNRMTSGDVVATVAEESRGVANAQEKTDNVAKVAEAATSDKGIAALEIDENLLEKFVAANMEHFENTGQLIPMRKLSRKFRKVRKSLEAMEREDLKKLFSHE